MSTPRFVALLLLAAGCNTGQIQHITVDGIERDYVVHVPPEVDGSVPPAVVFMLHGTGGSGLDFYRVSHWAQTSDAVSARWEQCDDANNCGRARENEEGGVITVFPSALAYCVALDHDYNGTVEGWYVTTKWVSGSIGTTLPTCPSSELQKLNVRERLRVTTLRRDGSSLTQELADDVAFIDALVEQVDADYGIDRSRIYVSGFSNGAQMSARLGLERPETFAAVSVASATPDTLGVAKSSVPIIASVGTLDPLFVNYRNPDPNVDPGLLVDEIPLGEDALKVATVYVTAQRLTSQSSLVLDDYSYAESTVQGVRLGRFTWDTPTNGVDNRVDLVLMKGIEHRYPNGDTSPLVIADEIWKFFSQYRRD
jgi:poly(3-hydroxybutyrate) depolymerase